MNSLHENLNIDESYIRRWVNDRLTASEIKMIKKKPKQTISKRKFPELEEQLFKWFHGLRLQHLLVTLKLFREEALKIFEKLNTERNPKYIGCKFCASAGWFSRFKVRYKISRRVQTHVAQKLANDYTLQIDKFIGRLRETK